MRDLRKHRRVPLINTVLMDTEKLRDHFHEGVSVVTSIKMNVGSGRRLSNWDEPTPILGNPVLPELAAS